MDIGHVPVFGDNGGRFEYVYARRKHSGLVYWLELSDDLISNVWINAGYSIMGTGPIDTEFDAVTNQIPDLGKTNQFIRLMIKQL